MQRSNNLAIPCRDDQGRVALSFPLKVAAVMLVAAAEDPLLLRSVKDQIFLDADPVQTIIDSVAGAAQG